MKVYLEHKRRIKDHENPRHPLYHPKYRIEKRVTRDPGGSSYSYKAYERESGKYIGKLSGSVSLRRNPNEFHVGWAGAEDAGVVGSDAAERARKSGQRFLPRDIIAHIIKHIKHDAPQTHRLGAERASGANPHHNINTRLRRPTPKEVSHTEKLNKGHISPGSNKIRYKPSYSDYQNAITLQFSKNKSAYSFPYATRPGAMSSEQTKHVIRQLRSHGVKELKLGNELHYHSLLLGKKPKKSVFYVKPKDGSPISQIYHSRKGHVGSIVHREYDSHLSRVAIGRPWLAKRMSFGDKKRIYKIIAARIAKDNHTGEAHMRISHMSGRPKKIYIPKKDRVQQQ